MKFRASFINYFILFTIIALSWVGAILLTQSDSASIQLLGWTYLGAKTINLITTLLSATKSTHIALRIFIGRYLLDSHPLHGLSQALTRYTLEIIQTFVGYNYCQLHNLFSGIDRVEFCDGATFTIRQNLSYSMGMMISCFGSIWIGDNVGKSFTTRVVNDPLFMHEYGHSFDSQLWAFLYLPVIGLCSFLSANRIINRASRHQDYWTEIRANRWAKHHFGNHYQVDWDAPSLARSNAPIEYYFPTQSVSKIT